MDKVGIAGAGTMGRGIAQVAAASGYEVALFDPRTEALEQARASIEGGLQKWLDKGRMTADERQAALNRCTFTDALEDMARERDWILEAIPEKVALKQQLFQTLEPLVPQSCLFGSNTSSLSISQIGEPLQDPGRLVGTHFFNPVPVMALLELIVSAQTRSQTLEAARALGERIGKEVIVVRDVPGFATSRLGVCLGMEAIRMVEQDVASAEDIDKAMVLGYRHPIGPLKLTDLVGLDVRLAIGEHLARELGNPAFEPPALLRQMVQEGKLGKKVGQGFYTWNR